MKQDEFMEALHKLEILHFQKLYALQIEEQEYKTEAARILLESTRMIAKENRSGVASS